MSVFKRPNFLGLLYICVFLIFLGRSLEALVWEIPVRTFLWDESILKPVIENWLRLDWTSYTSSMKVDRWIQVITYFLGVILLLASISTLLLWKNYKQRILRITVALGTVIIGVILILEYKEKFYHFAQFLEGFTQFFTPIFLLLYLNNGIDKKGLRIGLSLIIALTFVGHGLYAINLYTTPGYFIDMMIVILGFSEDLAKQILLIVGWIDILLILLFFIPFTRKAALYYAFIWGLLTALARFVYHFKLLGFDFHSINIIHTTLYRLPHGLVPLVILYLLNLKSKNISYESI